MSDGNPSWTPMTEGELFDMYPEIFRDRCLPPDLSCMHWGIECGRGWFWLIDLLCMHLQSDVEMNEAPQVIATQVKEKMGRLCFHWRTEGGTPESDLLIQTRVDAYQEVSARICEECGFPGRTRRGPAGWLKTLCDTHAKEQGYGDG